MADTATWMFMVLPTRSTMPTTRAMASTSATANSPGCRNCSTATPINSPATTPTNRDQDRLKLENGSARRVTNGTMTANTGG